MENKRCIVCNEEFEKGIYIKGEFICTSCEEKIVNCDLINDDYEVYLKIIKDNIVEKHMI